MIKSELVRRSPLRILDKSTHGGLDTGKLGIIASRKGVGKTACLVHLAADQLLQGKHVIHVSFAESTEHILAWYDAIFQGMATLQGGASLKLHEDLEKNRVIMSYRQGDASAGQVISGLDALISKGNFKAELVVLDGYDFHRGDSRFIDELKEYAASHGIRLWMTADASTDSGLPHEVPAELQPYAERMDIIINLLNQGDHMCLHLSKDHSRIVEEDLHLKLDARTLLIMEQ